MGEWENRRLGDLVIKNRQRMPDRPVNDNINCCDSDFI
jgi:hypothetical protein